MLTVDFDSHRPHHAVGAGGLHPTELPRVDDPGRIGVVGASLEGCAPDVTHSLDEPARRQSRVLEDPQLATSDLAAAQGDETVAGAQGGAHRVLDDGEPSQRPVTQRMVSVHVERVG